MPSDILRDEETGRLELPEQGTPAERELYQFMNTLEGWPRSSTAEVTFSKPVADRSVNTKTIKVYRWQDGKLSPFNTATIKLGSDGKTARVAPPRTGWVRGATFVIAVRGGDRGVRGARNEPVTCDPTFYFLRVPYPLNSNPDFRAFPGATRAEREKAAWDLEQLRGKLSPYFAALERQQGIARDEVAALWSFTINDHTEVLMDKESGEMPLPVDLLLDPKTGKVDLPEQAGDSPRDREIKRDLGVLDGFSTTGSQLFELSRRVDPKTVTPATVELHRVKDGAKVKVEVELVQDSDGVRVEVIPQEGPLDARTTYAVVLRPGIRDTGGRPVRPMLIGHFLRARHPLWSDGKSQLPGRVDDASAEQLEWVRRRVSPLLDRMGRDSVLTAWPFTTLSVVEPLLAAARTTQTHKLPVEPIDLVEKTAAKAASEFPIGALSVLRVGKVINGKIATADFLDPRTRRPYPDGSYRERWIPFTMTIPKSARPDEPLPVVIFGHAICTERRFVLAVADGLARKGFAAISIDLPYHGARTHCAWNGPVCWPDPLSKDGSLICPDPCPGGSACHPDGKCRDKAGVVHALTEWPVIPMKQASGAAFIELSSIASTMSHFRQAVIDLAALSRALRNADWNSHIGYTLKTDGVGYLGQSLGGILGGAYVAVDPAVDRAVLNVPGANLVPMFQSSPFFKHHIDAFLAREGIEKGTAEYQRFLVIAKWFMDAVDPINLAGYLMEKPLPGQVDNDRQVLVQMATLDFIIPNSSTKELTRLAGVQRLDYVAEHAFLVIPVEPAYPAGTRDAADFLAGSIGSKKP